MDGFGIHSPVQDQEGEKLTDLPPEVSIGEQE